MNSLKRWESNENQRRNIIRKIKHNLIDGPCDFTAKRVYVTRAHNSGNHR